jgi:transcriptional regulator with XRE-family HTH domain
MDQNLTDLAGRLRGLRSDSGLTLRELSSRVHVSDSSLSRYFTAQVLPPWGVVESLADLVGASPVELRSCWDAASRARREARWATPAAPVSASAHRRGVVPLVVVVVTAGAIGWALRRS